MKITFLKNSLLILFVTIIVLSCTSTKQGGSGKVSVANTVWTGLDSDGDYYEYTFRRDGKVDFRNSSKGSYDTSSYSDDIDVWKQEGSKVTWVLTEYATWIGEVNGNKMTGKASNITDKNWTFSFTKKK